MDYNSHFRSVYSLTDMWANVGLSAGLLAHMSALHTESTQ